MKIKLLFLFTLVTLTTYAQKEASNWYFGVNAGLKFNDDGSTTPLTDGQLVTEEGCASLSDTNGNLLFYTNGITVYNKNHQIMLNGAGLLGHSSTTQSATIVQKPNSSNLFYVFTLDYEAHPNGLRYSIIDLSLDGGLGGIIPSQKNISVITPTLEHLGVTKHANKTDYWIVTHGVNSNTFYCYLLTENGLSATPIINNIGTTIIPGGFPEAGTIKIAPNGDKLAFTSSFDVAQLFDFNNETGVISNPITLLTEFGELYGCEFSPNQEVLYISNPFTGIYQFDLTATDIPNSKTIIYEGDLIAGAPQACALQLGINGKIYIAFFNQTKLGIINNPDLVGTACNFQLDGVDIANRISKSGLPSFITSFFITTFSVKNLCLGDITEFLLNNTEGILSVHWDFGDGTTSIALNPTHSYTSVGVYEVVLTVTTLEGIKTTHKNITISPIPIANSVTPQIRCAESGSLYDLVQHNPDILGTQADTQFGVAYYNTAENAQNNFNQLPNTTLLPIGEKTIYYKVYNLNNINCSTISSFKITTYKKPTATQPNDLYLCDENDDTTETFNLDTNTSQIIGSQNPTNYTVSYHLSQSDATAKTNELPLMYVNTLSEQTIYARIENNLYTSCYTITSFKIGLYKKPKVITLNKIELCDDGDDLKEEFNFVNYTNQILQAQETTNYSVSYYSNLTDAIQNINSITENFINTTNPQTIYTRISNTNNIDCFKVLTFQIEVMPKPIININENYTFCEDGYIRVDAPLGFHSYEWSNGASSSSSLFFQEGNYSLKVKKQYNSVICETVKNFTVKKSSKAKIINIDVSDWSENSNNINVFVEGFGAYKYSLDNITYQDSNTFSNITSGNYTVYIKDAICGVVSKEVFVLNYNKYFTPNNDGFNDFWYIQFYSSEPHLTVEIYDRYGKLLKVLDKFDYYWDGNFNNNPCPANDYWFIVKREDGKTHKGHFTLKR